MEREIHTYIEVVLGRQRNRASWPLLYRLHVQPHPFLFIAWIRAYSIGFPSPVTLRSRSFLQIRGRPSASPRLLPRRRVDAQVEIERTWSNPHGVEREDPEGT